MLGQCSDWLSYEAQCVCDTAAIGPLILLLLHMSSKEADRNSCCSWLGTSIPHANPIALANPSVSLHTGQTIGRSAIAHGRDQLTGGAGATFAFPAMPPALLAGGRQPLPIKGITGSAGEGLPVKIMRRSGQITATNISHELPWLQVGADCW